MSENIIVDGEMVEIKILEEWGFNLGDDVCLYDEDAKSDNSSQGNVDIHEEFEMDNNVEIMTDKIVKDLVEADDGINKDTDGVSKDDVETMDTIEGFNNDAHSMGSQDSPMCSHLMAEITQKDVNFVPTEALEMTTDNVETEGGNTQMRQVVRGQTVSHYDTDVELPRKRRNTGPSSSGENRNSLRSGLWSVDWLHDIEKVTSSLFHLKTIS